LVKAASSSASTALTVVETGAGRSGLGTGKEGGGEVPVAISRR